MRRRTVPRLAHLAAPCAALLCLLLPHAVHATSAAVVASAPAATDDRHVDLVASSADGLVEWTRNEFTLSPGMRVDADVRSRMETLVAGFAERQRPLYAHWARELVAGTAGRENATTAVGRGMWPRVVAALADWRLRSAGPAHEALVRQAAQAPADCRLVHRARTTLDEIAALTQATPAAQRDALMDGERKLLAQWGGPPVVVAASEEPGRDVARWALALRHGDPHDTLPMAPWLAGIMTAEPPDDVGRAGRCAARQWWLANRLHQAPADGEAIWRAWHLAFARDLVAFNNPTTPYPAAGGSVDYPLFTRHLGLQGSVRVSVERDSRGHFKSGEVTQRRLEADMLPGRSVPMFEHLLDAPSLARARELTNEQAAAAAPGASAATAGNSTFEFNWRME